MGPEYRVRQASEAKEALAYSWIGCWRSQSPSSPLRSLPTVRSRTAIRVLIRTIGPLRRLGLE